MNATLYIRQIANGFVVGRQGLATLNGPTNEETYFATEQDLRAKAADIFLEALAAAQAERDQMADAQRQAANQAQGSLVAAQRRGNLYV